jgi:hypothetical protein
MRLGDLAVLKAALRPYYGETYCDDADVVRLHGEDQSTCARLYPHSTGKLLVVPVWKYEEFPDEAFIIDVPGSGPEDHEIPKGDA